MISGIRPLKLLFQQVAPPVLTLAIFLSLWETVCRIYDIKEYLIPRPTRIAEVIHDNFQLLLADSLVTFTEAALGFIIAFTIAFIVALTFTRFRLIEQSFMPYLVAFQAVPIIAMAPLLVLWFGNGLPGKIIMAAIICFFPAVVSITRGLRSVNPEALMMMKSLSASALQILLKLRIPSAMPFVFSAMRISATLSVIGAIVAEFSGAKSGIGFRIIISTYRTDTSMLFAALICSILLGMAFFGAMVLIENTIRRMRPVGHTA